MENKDEKPKMASIIFRIEEDLKKAFEEIAKRNDMTTSQLLRHFVRSHVRANTKPAKQAPQPQQAKQPQAKQPKLSRQQRRAKARLEAKFND